MSTAHQFAGALQGLSQNLGALAGYEASKEEMAAQQAMEERKEAASRAFQTALFNARAAQDQQQFDATLSARKDEQAQEMDYRNRSLAEQTAYHQDALGQQAADRAASRALQERGLDIEQQNANSAAKRADAATSKEKTDKQSGVIGTRLTAVGRLLDSYQKQKQAELSKLGQDITLMADPKAMAQARERVAAKYDPLIEKRQGEYDRLNAKFGELTGVPMGDAEEASTVGDLQAEAQRGFAPGGDPMTAPPAEEPYTDDSLNVPSGTPGQSPGYQSAPGPGNAIKSLADIPPDAIAYLRAHPELLQAFDQKYGPGTGEQILGKPSGGE